MTQQDALLDLAAALAGPAPHAAFEAFLNAHGVRAYFYGFGALRTDLHDFGYTEGLYYRHTYCAEWEDLIGPQSVLDHDASLDAMTRGQLMVEWDPPESPTHLQSFTPAQRRQWEIEHDLGMKNGASMLLNDCAIGFSGIGLWYETQPSLAAFRREWAAQADAIQRAAHLYDAALRVGRPNELVRLTPREIDCLSWLARGLRAAEICWKLGITEKTFEKHIFSAKSKLKSRTRDQALAKAVLMGLLPL